MRTFSTERHADAHRKTRTEKPQRWTIAGTENNELFVRAFGPEPNVTAQGEVVKQLGEYPRGRRSPRNSEPSSAPAKPGTVPAHIKSDSTNASNPFLKLRGAEGKVDPDIGGEGRQA